MHLLRVITNDKQGNFLTDNWHKIKSFEEVVKKVKTIQPNLFECYEIEEITPRVISTLIEQEEMEAKLERRRLYEELRQEFDPEMATT